VTRPNVDEMLIVWLPG